MATDHCIPREYSLRPQDLLPPDEDDARDQDWREYCAEAAQVSPERILECVLSALDGPESPLVPLIASALEMPHEPRRARESITVLAGLGQQVLDLIAEAVDAQVGLRMACLEGR